MLLAATWVGLEAITLSEGSHTEKDKYYTISLIGRIWAGKNALQMKLFEKLKHSHRHRKQTNGYQRGKEGKRDKLGT